MNRLWVKLTGAFLVVSLAAIGVVGAFFLRATDTEFRQYVVASGMGSQAAAAEALTEYYLLQGSWEGVESLLAQLGPGAMGMGMMGRGGLGGGGMAGPNLAVADAGGRVLASRTGELVGETLPQSVIAQGVPILVSGRQVGTLLNVPRLRSGPRPTSADLPQPGAHVVALGRDRRGGSVARARRLA